MFAIKQLLNPINDARPCGEDLSFSNDLDAIAEARRFDDPSLDQGEWVTELKEADWGFVIERCGTLLESRSKDLRLAVWLTEANAKVNHFAGLVDGYLLLSGLFDHFWDGLYPLADSGDQEQRIGNLYWLLTRSVQLVREIPITEGKSTGFSSIDFDVARMRAANLEKAGADTTRQEAGPKMAELDGARRRSSREFYETLLAESQRCLLALGQLEKSVDARLGMNGPGFSAVREALDDVVSTVSRFAQEAGIRTHAYPAEALQQDAATQGNSQVRNQVNGPIQTRRQALEQLRLVADFFRHTEPHSPVAYLADKAAKWGEMPLHAWLSTVIKDPASLAHIEELLGVKTPSGEM